MGDFHNSSIVCALQLAGLHFCGHLSSVHHSAKVSNAGNQSRTTHRAKWIEEAPQQQENNDSTIFQLSGKSPNPFTVELHIQGKLIQALQLYTLISEQTYYEHYQDRPLQKSSLKLKTYTEDPLQVLGQMTVNVSYHIQQGSYTLYVVRGSGPNLLGRDWLKHVRLDWRAIATYLSTR